MDFKFSGQIIKQIFLFLTCNHRQDSHRSTNSCRGIPWGRTHPRRIGKALLARPVDNCTQTRSSRRRRCPHFGKVGRRTRLCPSRSKGQRIQGRTRSARSHRAPCTSLRWRKGWRRKGCPPSRRSVPRIPRGRCICTGPAPCSRTSHRFDRVRECRNNWGPGRKGCRPNSCRRYTANWNRCNIRACSQDRGCTGRRVHRANRVDICIPHWRCSDRERGGNPPCTPLKQINRACQLGRIIRTSNDKVIENYAISL